MKDARVLQIADDLEQQLNLLLRKNRGRLVQEDHKIAVDPLLQCQHLGQFHQLTLSERLSLRRDRARVDVQFHLGELLTRFAASAIAVQLITPKRDELRVRSRGRCSPSPSGW